MRSLLFMTFLLSYSFGNSQPVFSSDDVGYAVGDSYVAKQFDYSDPGTSGAGLTWDYSSLVLPEESQALSIESPSDYPNASLFPEANVVLVDPTLGELYTNVNSSGQYQIGIDIPNLLMTYSDPEQFYAFPLSYNSTWSDDWSGTFFNGVQFVRAGTTSGLVDGYGTLITPNGTHENVLRVKIIQDYSDTYEVSGVPFTIDYYVEIYAWLKAGHPNALLTFSSIDTGFGVTTYGAITDDSATSLDEFQFDEPQFTLRPNPASDYVILQVQQGNSSDVQLTCFDLNASRVLDNLDYQLIGHNEVRIELSDLSKGSYLISAVSNGVPYSKVLIVL